MTDNNWSRFKITADFNTDARTIYQAWTTPDGLESWFLRKANFYAIAGRLRESHESILKEDVYEWYWHGYDDSTMEKGEVLEVNSIDFLKFTFSGGSVVSISLESRNGITILELTQENIPQENDPLKNLLVQCQVGWTFYLANLKSIVEGGIDLRNKRMDIGSNFK
jgi:uncharacterized protein YndB with AHSA1/START domain